MAKIKDVHFGERLRLVRKAKFTSQADLAKFLHERGVMNTPSQNNISRWEGMASLDSKNIKEALWTLREKGVNPRFFFYAHVTDWQGPVEQEVGDTDILKLRLAVAKLQQENAELTEMNRRLMDRIEELTKSLGP